MVAVSIGGARLNWSRVLGALALPSTVDLLFVALAFSVPLAFTSRLFAADGDIGRHIRVGSDILASHALFFRDHYSFTMAGQPFVPYEWLSEVVFALANQIGGLAAVAVVTGLVVALTYSLVVVFLRRSGVDPLLALLVGLASAMVGLVHWLARPHLFTPLGAILALLILEKAGARSRWLVIPLFILWANLHGGFVYGLILIALYLVGDLLEAARARPLGRPRSGVDAATASERDTWLRRARGHVLLLLGAGVGCCINPTGPALFAHITGFLGDRLLVDRTLEYMSPDFHNVFGQLFLAVVLGCVTCLALSKRRPTYAHLLLFLVNVAFAMYSWRNIPLFAVTALPIVALMADRGWRAWPWARRIRSVIANGERDTRPGWWATAGCCILILIAARHGQLGSINVSSQFDATHFPVKAVEVARQAGLSGNLFNEFIWGGYVLYAWPEQRVFIDGQTDFYGDAVTRRYLQISELQDGWRDAIRAEKITTVLVPTSSLLARELAREPGWKVWYRDDTAVILVSPS